MEVRESISNQPGPSTSINEVEESTPAESTSLELKDTTRIILEDVCADFETMDVVPLKVNKTGVIRNSQRNSPLQQRSNQTNSTSKISKDLPSKKPIGKKVCYKNVAEAEQVRTKQKDGKIPPAVASTSSEVKNSQQSASVGNVNAELEVLTNSNVLPSNNCQIADGIPILQENIIENKNMSSLAQLADVELVRSGDNVSIVVTNTRFIDGLMDPNNPVAGLPAGTVIEAPLAVLEPNISDTSQIDLDPLLTNYEDITTTADSLLNQKKIISGRKSYRPVVRSTAADNKVKRKGRPPKYPIMSGITSTPTETSTLCYKPYSPFTKGRQVTARMKQAWARLLEIDGHLACQMDECSQTFVTVANFTTHFKYCMGKKTLKKCDHCDSMIFSTQRAVLQHLEVEHPEHADAYRAAHPDVILNFEVDNLVSKDENVAMNVEEVTHQPQKYSRKRKLSEKETVVPRKKIILKHKLQSIQNSMAENAKEFKKCVRFDAITDAINSVDEACNVQDIEPLYTPGEKPKKQRKRVLFTERIVAENKYFEDDDDVDNPETLEHIKTEEEQDQRERLHTKARMLLNLDRYKRYQEYLTVTRDWSSARKTYSRSRGSDVSAENSFVSPLQDESFRDIHLLNTDESLTLKKSDIHIERIQITTPERFQVLETPEFVSVIPFSTENEIEETTAENNLNKSQISLNEITEQHGEKSPDMRVKREKTACYNRVNFETPKPKQRRGNIITYGVQAAVASNKPVEPPITFDSLVNSMKPKPARRNSRTGSVDMEKTPQQSQEDGIELTNIKIEKSDSPKKRGRPPKPQTESPTDTNENKTSKDIGKNRKVTKYSLAMLKNLEKNMRYRKMKLYGKKMFKKFAKASKLQSGSKKKIRLQQSKHNLLLKKVLKKGKKLGNVRTIGHSTVQYQENVDNTLHLGLSSHQIYTSTLNSVLEITDANILAGEIEVAASTVENLSESVVPTENVNAVIQESKEPESAVISNINKGIYNESAVDVSKNNSQNEVDLRETNKTKAMETDRAKVSDLGKVRPGEANKTGHAKDDTTIVTESNKIGLTDADKSELTAIEQSEKGIKQGSQVQPVFDSVTSVQKNIEANQGTIVEDAAVSASEKVTEKIPVDQKVQASVADKLTQKQAIVTDKEAVNFSHKIVSAEKHTQPNRESIDHLNKIVVEEHTVSVAVNGNQDTGNLTINKQTVAAESSELNQTTEDVIPEVKRRSRGRPRKMSNKQSTSKHYVVSPEQNALKIDKSNESSGTKNVQANNERKVEHNIVAEDDQMPVRRKSERVRRRNLVNDLQTTLIEEKQREVTPTARGGQHGKTLKGSVQDASVESSVSKIVESVQNVEDAESEDTMDENMRKNSRKGRPRKYVRYVDLNSGVESSESLEGVSSGTTGKDKSDLAKVKGVKKSYSAKNSEEGIEVADFQNTSKEQEENIVLPLKKRKQRQIKKDEAENESSTSNKHAAESIIVVSDVENQEKSEDGEVTTKTPKSVRSKSARGAKRKRQVESSDEEWDPEVHLQHNKQSLRPSRKKSQLDIRALEDETSESSSSERRDPTVDFTKRSTDTRRLSTKHMSKAKSLDIQALKYSLKTSPIVLAEYKPNLYTWKLLKEGEYILPPMKKSVYFKVEKVWEEQESYWNSLSLFDSLPMGNDFGHSTFFAGGPVTCSAWCPVPIDGNKVQYIAVATDNSLNNMHSYLCDEPKVGYIQLWNMGDLTSKILQRKPFVELCIYHSYGPINDMVWCPIGCWETPTVESSTDVLPQLGLLALACSDGRVRIYSIPHPHLLPKEETGFPIYSTEPSIVLDSLFGDICNVTRPSICVCVTWEKSELCERVAAGYGCGLISIWRINTSATILSVKENDQIIISPYLVFNAHGTPVLRLSFSPLPGGRYLVSSSIDKTLKFWDLIDTSMPIFSVKKGAGKCAEWSSHYCGAFGSVQYGMRNYTGSTFFKECGTENFSSRSLSNQQCSAILNSLSDWLSAQAIADLAGNLSVSFTHTGAVVQEYSKSPLFFHRFVYQSKLKPLVGKITVSNYSQSVSSVQEMTEMTSMLNKVIEMGCEVTDVDINSLRQQMIDGTLGSLPVRQYTEFSEKVNCILAMEQMKEIVSIVHETVEECKHVNETVECCIEEVKENLEFNECISNTISEIVDIVTTVSIAKDIANVITDVKDIVHVVTDMKDITQIVTDMKDIATVVRDMQDINHVVTDVADVTHIVTDMNDVTNLVTDMRDVAEVVTDMKDVAHVVTDMKDVAHVITDMKDVTDVVTDMTDVAHVVTDMKDITHIVKHMKDITHVVKHMKDVAHVVTDMKDIAHTITDIKDITQAVIEINDITHAVTDIQDVAHAVDELAHHTQETSTLHNIIDVLIKATEEKQLVPCDDGKTKVEKDAMDRSIIADIQSQGIACISAVEELSNVISVVEHVTKKCVQNGDLNAALSSAEVLTGVYKDKAGSQDMVTSGQQNKKVVIQDQLTNDVSQVTDIVTTIVDIKDASGTMRTINDAVEVVLDMKDTTELIVDMNDATEVIVDMKEATENILNMNDATEIACGLRDTTEIVCDLQDATEAILNGKEVISSAGDMEAETLARGFVNSATGNDNGQDIENEVLSEISMVLRDSITYVSEEINNEFIVKELLEEIISNIQMVDKCESQSFSALSHDATNISIMGNNSMPLSDVYSEPSAGNNESSIKSSSLIPPVFGYPLSAIDEEMLSADSESSDSEIDIDIDDEMDECYMFVQDSNLSDDSMLSERSLDSAASICSFSTESDMSEVSSDVEIEESVTLNQSNAVEAEIVSSESVYEVPDVTLGMSHDVACVVEECSSREPDIIVESPSTPPASYTIKSNSSSEPQDVTFESPQCSPSSNVLKTTSCEAQNVIVESPPSSPLSSVLNTNSSELQNVTVESPPISPACNVLNSGSDIASSELFVDDVLDLNSVSEPNVPDVPDTVLSDELLSIVIDNTNDLSNSETLHAFSSEISDEVSTDVVLKTANVSNDGLSVDLANEIVLEIHPGDKPLEQSCDINSCSAEISMDSCIETITENTEKDCTENLNLVENVLENTVPPEIVEISSTFDSSKNANINIERENINNNLENNRTSIETEPVVNTEKIDMPHKKITCYEDVMSQYGIVFRDMNTANFEKIKHENFQELTEFSLSPYHLTSIKTVSWNPNFGSHNWLFSAGQSGIARLSYISDVDKTKCFDRKYK